MINNAMSEDFGKVAEHLQNLKKKINHADQSVQAQFCCLKKSFIDALKKVEEESKRLSGVVEGLCKRVDQESEKLEGVSTKVDQESEKLEGISEKVDRESMKLEGVSEKVEGVSEKVDRESMKLEGVSMKVDQESEKLEGVSKKVDKESMKLEGVSEKVDKESMKLEGVSEKVDIESMKLEGVSEKVDKESMKLEGVSRKVDEKSEKLDQESRRLDTVTETASDFTQLSREVFELKKRVTDLESSKIKRRHSLRHSTEHLDNDSNAISSETLFTILIQLIDKFTLQGSQSSRTSVPNLSRSRSYSFSAADSALEDESDDVFRNTTISPTSPITRNPTLNQEDKTLLIYIRRLLSNKSK